MRATIVAATDLPVAADLENGFGESPEASPRRSAWPPRPGWSAPRSRTTPATRRVRSTTSASRSSASPPPEAARALPFRFTLTARCEYFLRGHADLAATIARLQAYEAAGADVLFAPALPDLEPSAPSAQR